MVEVEMEMEMDEGPPLKRLGVKHTIQTSFGDDYVFQIASWYSKLLFSISYILFRSPNTSYEHNSSNHFLFGATICFIGNRQLNGTNLCSFV